MLLFFKVERLQNAILLCFVLKFSISISVALFPVTDQYFKKNSIGENKIFLCWSIILNYLLCSGCRTSSTSSCLICFSWVLNEHFVVHCGLWDVAQLSSLRSIFSLVLLGCYLFPIFCIKWLFFCRDMEPQYPFLLTQAESITKFYIQLKRNSLCHGTAKPLINDPSWLQWVF